ncbi:stage II sporulation protein M [Brevibacillus humidisoli]|uniref:stage II sporulation protein M n=1 Tax=Brevibacillus humidisoli TaxID=2895522 RepID=UPI001E4289B2|nr:stage II sporulation protein M [Brevibacillus humidisoli]UFJ40699.1 stage II sporulation protein M [Brevibacillus humidisoli]
MHKLKDLWLGTRWYFATGCLLMLGGALVGFFQAETIQEMAKAMLAQLQEIADTLKENNTTANAFWLIFKNNVTSSVLMMVLGLFFAVFPISGLVSNGVLLGYILEMMSSGGINWLQVFVVGILPHGIFELPAVIFAASLGIRYGVLALRSIGALWRSDQKERVKHDWQTVFRQFPLALFTVVALLFVAAIVESVITPILIQNTFGTTIQMTK